MNNINAKQRTRRKPILRSIASFTAAAAVMCLILIGNSLLSPTDSHFNNLFTLRAYAFEQREDGSVKQREIDILDQATSWQGHMDGERFFASVGLRFDGENIKQVEFMAESGFFAAQRIGDLSSGTQFGGSYLNGISAVLIFGTEFEIMGNNLVFDENGIDEDLLLFWGTETNDRRFIPTNVYIRVFVTFNDGETMEDILVIDFESRIGLTTIPVCEYEMYQRNRISEYYMNLPLNELELVAVATFTPALDYDFGDYDAYYYDFGIDIISREGVMVEFLPAGRLIIKDWLEFDEDGVSRRGFQAGDKGMYLTVFHRCDEGVVSGHLYRAPFYE